MSKVSVFKYNTNGNEVLIRQLINDYLTTRNFVYNEEEQAYIFNPKDNRSTSDKIIEGVAQGLVSALLSGGSSVSVERMYDGSFCFQYSIENDLLIIKAYLKDKNGFKNHITQSALNKPVPAKNYYDDLKKFVFNNFENNNITLRGTEVETIKDGKMNSATLALLIYFGVIALFIIIFIIVVSLL